MLVSIWQYIMFFSVFLGIKFNANTKIALFHFSISTAPVTTNTINIVARIVKKKKNWILTTTICFVRLLDIFDNNFVT